MTISTGTPVPAGLPTTAAPTHLALTKSTDLSAPRPTVPSGDGEDSDGGSSHDGAVDESTAPSGRTATTGETAPAQGRAVAQGTAVAGGTPAVGAVLPVLAPDGAAGAPSSADDDDDADADADADADDGPDTVDTGPVPRLERLREALPTLPGPGLTVAGGTVLGAALVGLGAALDIALGDGLGLGFRVTFVVTCIIVAFAVRVRALGAAVVLPPLLYAAAAALQTVTSGQTTGRRAAALDVATTLALSAPLLFLGTAVAAAIVLSRGLAHLVRR